jgi:hypothetical protein
MVNDLDDMASFDNDTHHNTLQLPTIGSEESPPPSIAQPISMTPTSNETAQTNPLTPQLGRRVIRAPMAFAPATRLSDDENFEESPIRPAGKRGRRRGPGPGPGLAA